MKNFFKAVWRQFVDGLKSLYGKLNNEQKAGIVRHGLTILGTCLVAWGAYSHGDWEKVAGGILALVTIILSVGSNKDTKEAEAK